MTTTTDLKIDQHYDRFTRSWVTMIVDATGGQIGDAMYDGHRDDAAASKRFMQYRIDTGAAERDRRG